jgi:DNA gyrase subunit A
MPAGLYRQSRPSSGALIDIVPGPDFPTGALIIGRSGPRRPDDGAAARDHARRVPSKRCARIARRSSSPKIPYQVNKATLIERIAELVRDKRIEGISDIRDESDRHGMRVVIELKRDASRRGAEPALPLHAAADELRRQHAGAQWRPPEQMGLRDMLAASSTSARKSSPAAPSSNSARRATAAMCWSVWPSPSPISTRSSA